MYQKTLTALCGIKFSILLIVSFFAFHFSIAQNAIVLENQNLGNLPSEWDIADGSSGDVSIQGFATDISVNRGSTINFKIDVNTGTNKQFGIKIYRIGYYSGRGARLIADLGTGFTGTSQAACGYDGTTGLTDCGNWTTTVSWPVPAAAVSGIYIAKLTRSAAGGGGTSHITFIVRNDASTAALLFKTSDATWQAYNGYGGNSLYVGATLPNNHASKVSYNRPFMTRSGGGGGGVQEDWFMNSEYPMIRFLEANGFDMTYTTDVDLVRSVTNPMQNHAVFLSVGHDEYWSKEERNAVEDAKTAGKHLAFFSGNEIYWKTRWENSLDNTTPYRTMVCYKEGTLPTLQENACGGKCDPSTEWTGLWRDGCDFPGGNACKPENGLSGEISWDGNTATMEVPDTYKNLRFWRNTPVAALTSGQTATLSPETLGYEWDWEQYLTNYPPGRFTMSSTSFDGHTHKLSLYKTAAGGWVFGAGTVQWAWGLDINHDRGLNNTVDLSMQQATINLFADMGVQPGSLQAGLQIASASTDVSVPSSIITVPANGSSFPQYSQVTISGTATDAAGGVVAGVEISFDGGNTWQATSGTTSWTYIWTPAVKGNVTIKTRAVDDSGNLEEVGGNEGSPNVIFVTVTDPQPPTNCPCGVFTPTQGPDLAHNNIIDGTAVTLGMKFKASFDGKISAIRFYKAPSDNSSTVSNPAKNVVRLYNLSGGIIGQGTLNSGTPGQWNTVSFLAPADITANTVYIAAYFTPTGIYAATDFGLLDSIFNFPLTAISDDLTAGGPNGVYSYNGIPTFPNPGQSYQASNYWIDVVYTPNGTGPDTDPPTVTFTSPDNGATNVNVNGYVSATFNEDVDPSTVNNTTFELRNAANVIVPSTINYTVSTRTATLIPNFSLNFSSTYTATIKGGATDPRIKDLAGNALAANYVWSFTTGPEPVTPPDEGAGGPILIIGGVSNPFSRYTAEILRAQGYTLFTSMDISEVTPAILTNYDVVILGQISLTGANITMLTNWTTAGGTLIAFRPDPGLSTLLGISPTAGTLPLDLYLKVNNATPAGAGIVNQTIQLHGGADLYTLGTATSLATLYSSVNTATTNPAVTTNNVGSNGGKAIAFTYDLARSVVYTRQGNPQWAGLSRDGQSGPIRSDNLFFPDYINLDKVQIPQADEQQHLLTNIMLLSNLAKKPLPHLWLLPNQLKAAVVMTGDDHNQNPGSTIGRFREYLDLSTDNSAQGVADWNWQTIRGTSYIYSDTPIPTDSVNFYQANGFEIALHPTTFCQDFTPVSLSSNISTQLNQLTTLLPTINAPVTNRTHCLPWSDWSSQATVENLMGMRFDVNYYYWPGSWVQNRPGLFTGSGMPMRFADIDGKLIDCYQAPTQMPDESDLDITQSINTLLDNAITKGYYGAFVMNMHTDTALHIGSQEIIASAQARQIPVISAKQMLTWLDTRNGTIFSSMAWDNTTKRLSFHLQTTARNLQAMVPVNSADGSLIQVLEGGADHTFTVQTIKGIAYGFFTAKTEDYVAIYSSTALPITLTSFTVTKQDDDARLNWSTSMESNNKGFEIQRSTDASSWTVIGFVTGAGNSQSEKDYQFLDQNLTAGTYYYRLRQVDNDGKSQTSKIEQVSFDGGLALALLQNRPNPFNNSTNINMVIPRSGRVQLMLYDQTGRLLQTLMDENKTPGTYTIPVNRNGLSSGIYFYRMNALGQSIVKKMTIL